VSGPEQQHQLHQLHQLRQLLSAASLPPPLVVLAGTQLANESLIGGVCTWKLRDSAYGYPLGCHYKPGGCRLCDRIRRREQHGNAAALPLICVQVAM
jgi:hypothetical protein